MVAVVTEPADDLAGQEACTDQDLVPDATLVLRHLDVKYNYINDLIFLYIYLMQELKIFIQNRDLTRGSAKRIKLGNWKMKLPR